MKRPAQLNTLVMLAAAFGLSVSSVAVAQLSDEDAMKKLKKNGCTKCHAVDKSKKGPAYKKVAEKFKGKPDGEEKCIKNITTGPKVKFEDGTEEEHKIIEIKDLGEQKALCAWILSR